jgi:rhodanese-related sulfurtransferase
MPLKMKKTVQQMVDEASAEIETVATDEALKLVGKPGVTFIDIRDPRELWRDGTIPGAINVTRGMLEMWIDPESPYAKEYFQTGNKFIFFCAGAWRSALATKTAKDMGLLPVAHLEGGLSAWKKAGGPVEKVEPKK